MIKKTILVVALAVIAIGLIPDNTIQLGKVRLELNPTYVERGEGGLFSKIYMSVLFWDLKKGELDDDAGIAEFLINIDFSNIYSKLGLGDKDLPFEGAIIYEIGNNENQEKYYPDTLKEVKRGVEQCGAASLAIAEKLYIQNYAQFYASPSGIGGEFGECGKKFLILNKKFDQIADLHGYLNSVLGECVGEECKLTISSRDYEISDISWRKKYLSKYYDFRNIIVKDGIKLDS